MFPISEFVFLIVWFFESEEIVVAVRLAKEGFGTIEGILNSPADLVLAAMEYTLFTRKYEEAYIQLNKE